MKDRIIAALVLLNSVTSDVRPGGQGEIQFKQALVELQGALDAPDQEPAQEPEKMIQAAEAFTGMLQQRLDALLGEVVSGFHEKLDGMITKADEADALMTAVSGKLDGLEDHMAAFMEVHVAKPEPEPAPAPTADEVAAAQAVIDAAAAAAAAA